jgi:hypothetical protein
MQWRLFERNSAYLGTWFRCSSLDENGQRRHHKATGSGQGDRFLLEKDGCAKGNQDNQHFFTISKDGCQYLR